MPSIDDYAATAAGREFFTRYDRITERAGTEALEVVTSHGVTRVNVAGPATGAPVVLLPGGGASSAAYARNIESLAATRRVFAIDLINDVGRSRPGPGAPRNTPALLDWVAAVLDDLGVDRTDLVGHSYGAMIALAFALAHRDRASGLVLLDPNSCFAGMRPGYLLHALPTLVRPSPARQRRLLEWEVGADLVAAGLDADWVELACAGARFPTGKTVVPRRPSAADLGVLADLPVTVVLAPNSRVHDVTAVADTVAKRLPHAEVVTLSSGSHHGLPQVPADELNRVLRAALSIRDSR